jgi:hypothetical protein
VTDSERVEAFRRLLDEEKKMRGVVEESAATLRRAAAAFKQAADTHRKVRYDYMEMRRRLSPTNQLPYPENVDVDEALAAARDIR